MATATRWRVCIPAWIEEISLSERDRLAGYAYAMDSLRQGAGASLCLLPFLWMMQQFRSGALGLEADPVNWITHFTGNWAVWILLASLSITPVRRLHPMLGNLIRFRRMLGLYAFFYATLHLATYVFLFSGYDLPTVLASVKAGHLGMIVDEWKVVWPTIWVT